ncbi:MAG: hypothetical protein QM813_24485 [Verrucomicrobiota bacterium]
MALSFPISKKINQIIAVDLGSRVTKAVLCESKGGRFNLSGYALLDTPDPDSSTFPPAALGEQLKEITKALNTRTKTIALAIGTENHSSGMWKSRECRATPSAQY